MGLMDMVSQMAGGGSQNGQVAGGLMQELQSSPGGMGGLLQMFHQNGMGGQVQQWAGGQTAPADPRPRQFFRPRYLQGLLRFCLGKGLIPPSC